MELVDPCPRYSPKGKQCPKTPTGQEVDYTLTAPLGEFQPLCKYTVPYPTPCATWTAGQSITVTFDGSATHGGGHCQWSISYDGGNTFVVLHQVLKYCFYTGDPNNGGKSTVRDYTFSLPSDLPSTDHAVFAWTWVNAIGNNEFYMNCADVTIKGSSSTGYTGPKAVIARHSKYPPLPDFNGNYDTGLDLYNNSANITVTSNGSGSTNNNFRNALVNSSGGDGGDSTKADTNSQTSSVPPINSQADANPTAASASAQGKADTLANPAADADPLDLSGIINISTVSTPSTAGDGVDTISTSTSPTTRSGMDTGTTAANDGSNDDDDNDDYYVDCDDDDADYAANDANGNSGYTDGGSGSDDNSIIDGGGNTTLVDDDGNVGKDKEGTD
ncbi:hypothetical protein IW140_005238 [Coemansia sp. RSA 1813]|nr:hypothetical protein EV178_005632 [Coemansia sp. RSA 1646]KAJ1768421.1 hypothetical protein LPJ74_004875 [Coemansia sp. RSA 1843]KAJ2214212.1 hypothetical protein EV179_003232 [Coemansia sp. RSA 487]KAJ2565653.1 hypothetical protein IW140_005238 [Coemansia sp. RSA 1813]